jgi:hypothetical protein
MGTLACKLDAYRLANPAGAARDQNYLAVEPLGGQQGRLLLLR